MRGRRRTAPSLRTLGWTCRDSRERFVACASSSWSWAVSPSSPLAGDVHAANVAPVDHVETRASGDEPGRARAAVRRARLADGERLVGWPHAQQICRRHREHVVLTELAELEPGPRGDVV